MSGSLEFILLCVYVAVSIWATNRTIYKSYVFFGTPFTVFSKKLLPSVLLGWLLIPIALLKAIFASRGGGDD